MAEYLAPLKDMKFVLKHVVGLVQVNELPGWEEVTEDLVDAILEEAGKLATELLSPLNAQGDRQGAKWKDGTVTTPAGFKEAYWQYCSAGWNNIQSPAPLLNTDASMVCEMSTIPPLPAGIVIVGYV